MGDKDSYEKGLRDGEQAATLQDVRDDIAELKGIISKWPKSCETHRGKVHERINKLYIVWLSGYGIIGIILVLLEIYRN